MCYDISFTINVRELSDYFPDLVFDDQLEINFQGAVHIMGHGYGKHPIIYYNKEDNRIHCKAMEWGCIPFYVKDEDTFKKQRATMLNARSERILEDTKSYWYKIRNRRCLIPMNAMYEHREIEGWQKKVPYIIGLKHQDTFFIPGLYSVVELPDKSTGELIKRWTYTLITREANSVMRLIHNGGDNKWRMPLYLTPELTRKWLKDDLTLEEYKDILNFEMPTEELQYHTVYTIRSPKSRPDDKEKNEFYEWPGLPELI
ncbi:SOS response-associated peptidase [Ginsengibacter hankyongi]|uniref:Abasic site processing protein n=1 Tax=Ginsengibacter hankyongi TaxID=2607284 RepID=A0A5J5IDB6_9BACT|nr:SOS response-associated peptidase family protein [Ginsengibacter hankyongi]KAA9037126.1 SOS response-associated peptidase [Ginsengibacter hankyongi]